ncbi:MAG: arsenic transporter [Rhizobiales bacterium]|nr:arsenic transporter [Hyphomicrobiales bacterium]
MSDPVLIWVICALAVTGVILRPFGWPEAVWAVLGAAALLALRLIGPQEALAGVADGTDVYLFLLGMMLLSEVARLEGLFDWLAAVATNHAQGSPTRLFLAIYGVGTLVTVFLSNDATAVVLTPAVAAAVRAARAKEPLPFLLICAFIANAASFVLPISNPANLVIYGERMPPLLQWLPQYALPSLAAIVVTYFFLRLTQRKALRQEIASAIPVPALTASGRTAALGIVLTGIVLLAASGLGWQLGPPTAAAGLLTTVVVLVRERRNPWHVVRDISWGVLPLVAGLFVLVAALDKSGLIASLAAALKAEAAGSEIAAAWTTGLATALAGNVMNNLPAGLIAADALHIADLPERFTRAVLIGIDIGPNLSVTGSLATILWLAALRREGLHVGAGAFLKVGVVVMPPALLAALALALL